MRDERRALQIFREVAAYNYPVALERVPSEGTKSPAGFQIVVKAKYMGAVEIGRMAKLAKKEDLQMSLRAVGDNSFMVLA